MAIKYPVLIPSCTLTSSGAIRLNEVAGAGGGLTATIPAGRYWNDPALYTGAAPVVDDHLAVQQLTYHTLATYGAGAVGVFAPGSITVSGMTVNPRVSSIFPDGADTIAVQAGNAATTDIGRRFLAYMGWDWYTDTTAANPSTAQSWSAYFKFPRPESADVDEMQDGFGAVVRLGGGAVYTGDLGEPLQRRMVSVESMPGRLVHKRESAADSVLGADYSLAFDHLVWRWASRGELLRYYADSGATNTTVLSASLARNAITCTVRAAGTIAIGNALCIDGEWVGVTNVAGTTLTLYRDAPVAHPKYAPVSSDFCGTYALAQDGGNINARMYAPTRRAPNQDRWDMEISLVRASWS